MLESIPIYAYKQELALVEGYLGSYLNTIAKIIKKRRNENVI